MISISPFLAKHKDLKRPLKDDIPGSQERHSTSQRIAFNQGPLTNLSEEDKILFEQFGQGPIVKAPYACIHHAFESQAQHQPDATAVIHQGDSITYEALNRQANRLARKLISLGVQPGDSIALFLQRSIPMVVGIMASLKCGASYAPQHVGVAPESQLEFVLSATSAKVILTLSQFKDLIPPSPELPVIAIDEEMGIPFESDQSFRENLSVDVQTENTCFILFTSGTTGNPNGVQVTHKNVCNILLTSPGNLGMQPGLKVSQILSIAFDMAAWEILGCLGNGATLLIRGKNIQEAVEQVDIVIATPSILGTIDTAKCQHIQVAAVAGEPCPKPLADEWSSFSTFFNSCGPTETTIINTAQNYTASTSGLTIGSPTPNNTVYILDANRQPCAIGEVGEMWAGGDCVSAGYLHNDALNEERYVPDPFLGEGRVMFRTRDLGRWTSNGELEHFGRTDDQVKIRGFRVELDSISNTIEQVPGCTQAVTLKLNNRNLVSFIRPASVNIEAAKEAVASSLPYYCVPEFILTMDQFPKTSRGKVDKRNLLEQAKAFQSTQLQTTELAEVVK